MRMKDYSEKRQETAVYPGAGTKDGLTYAALGLNGEAGEVAEQVKKAMRDDKFIITEARKTSIIRELGDTLWYLDALCFELGVTLEEVAATNIAKLADRARRNTLSGSGSDR